MLPEGSRADQQQHAARLSSGASGLGSSLGWHWVGICASAQGRVRARVRVRVWVRVRLNLSLNSNPKRLTERATVMPMSSPVNPPPPLMGRGSVVSGVNVGSYDRTTWLVLEIGLGSEVVGFGV